MTDATLLSPAFVRELETLKRRLDIRARSAQAGERTAARRGSSAEFREHRAYSPGDDLRRIDWLAYARSGHPVSKVHVAEEDVVVRLVVDASESLAFGEPLKIEIAKRMAAAIGYLALSSSERAQLFVAHGGDRPSPSVSSPVRGRQGVAALLRSLSLVHPAGRVDLSKAIERVLSRSARPGLLVLVSDFLDSGPVVDQLRRARAAGHDLVLLHIMARDELEPILEGDVALVDAETGAEVSVTVDATAIDAYVLRVTGLVEELRAFARSFGATYVRLLTDDALEPAVRRIVSRAVD